jgi:hypothetical protein
LIKSKGLFYFYFSPYLAYIHIVMQYTNVDSWPFGEEWQKKLKSVVGNNPRYLEVKNTFLMKVKDYQSKTKEQRHLIWECFYKEILDIGWTRVYGLLFVIEIVKLIPEKQEELLDDIDKFLSEVDESEISLYPEKRIRFKNEPKDWESLRKYIDSNNWRKEENW